MGKESIKQATSIKTLRKLVQQYRKDIKALPKPQNNPGFSEQTKYVWVSEADLEVLLNRCKCQYGTPDNKKRTAGIKFYFGTYNKDTAPEIGGKTDDRYLGMLTLASVGCMKIEKKEGSFIYKDAISRKPPVDGRQVYQDVFDLGDGDEGDNHGHMCPPHCDDDDDDIVDCLENEEGCEK